MCNYILLMFSFGWASVWCPPSNQQVEMSLGDENGDGVISNLSLTVWSAVKEI